MGSVTSSNPGGALQGLRSFARLTDTSEHAEMLKDAGQFMALQIIPMRFAQGGPDSQNEPWVNNARGGAPLRDKGIMQHANDYEVRGNTLIVGNSRVQARLMNQGGPLAGQKAKGGQGGWRVGEQSAFQHYKTSYNPKASMQSLGWMYVKKREFVYFGEYALNRILGRWRKRWKADA